MTTDTAALVELVEEVATLLEATVRAEEGVFHLAVPISGDTPEDEEDEDEDAGSDEPTVQVSVALSLSEDGSTLFATRRLCALDETIDLVELLREVGGTIHVQLSVDEDDDIVLGGAAPIGAPAEWIADLVGELAELAPDLAEDAAPIDEDGGE